MRHTLLITHLLAILIATPLVSAADLSVPLKILSFNPPDSVSFKSTVVTSRMRFVDTMPPLVDSTHVVTDYVLTRSAGGFSLTGTQVSTEYSRNGKKIENDISRISSNITVITELDRQGVARAVLGYEKLFDRIDSLPDKKTAEALKQVFKPGELSARDISEWNSRMSHVREKALKLGVVSHDTGSIGIGSGGNRRIYTITEFTDTIRADGRLSLRVKIVTATKLRALGQSLHLQDSTVGSLFNLPDSVFTVNSEQESEYHSYTELLFDVETLLVQRESQRREISAPVQTNDGRTVISRMIESLEKVFDFDM